MRNLRKKNAPLVCLVILLLFGTATVQVGASETVVSVKPKSYTAPDIGHIFTIEVTIANVTNLTGFEFKLYWNRKLLKVTDATYEAPPAWTNPLWVPYQAEPLNNEYNATHGRFWLGCTNLPPKPVSGDFILATLTFKVKGAGNCPLDLRDTKLVDNEAKLIPHETVDGEFRTSAQPGTPSTPFSVENIVIVIVIVTFFVAVLYYVRKRILK